MARASNGPVELWTLGVASPTRSAEHARRAEAAGWDGWLVVDSQNLSGDPYVALALAAQATTTLGLGTGVTNPYTRHAAATACSIATVQAVSKGRAVLGIGRGDSSLAHLGLAPASPAAFEHYLRRLQGYLRGDEVPFTDGTEAGHDVSHVDALGLGDAPTSSRIHWLPQRSGKVPVDVAATGPKVIALAARHADRITFALGADATRIRWGIDLARRSAEEAGRDPDELSFGAWVSVVTHEDVAVARQLIAGSLATFARFAVMHGTPQGPADQDVKDVLTAVHHAYDMNHHTQVGTAQTAVLTPEFIDTYGIVGTVDRCAQRLADLAALGLDRMVLLGASAGSDPALMASSRSALETEVMPKVRALTV